MGHSSGKDDRSSSDRKKECKDPPIVSSTSGAKSKLFLFIVCEDQEHAFLSLYAMHFPMKMPATLEIAWILMHLHAFPQPKIQKIRRKRW
jgi:hypothetical protein